MRKTFKLDELGCANCAAKMEAGIAALEGVTSARVNFMAAKLTLEADDERFDAIVDQAQRICWKYEPDCTIVR